MKKVLLLMVAVIMVSNVAMADHLGIYTDVNGSSCALAPGFTSTAAVIHKFSLGTTGVRFKMDISGAPGTGVFGFTTGYTPVGNLTTDLSVGYGDCLVGTVMIGTIVANLAVGVLAIKPADGFGTILYTNCSFAELDATGGRAYVGSTGDCGEVAVETSTWGQVKALYR